MPVPLATRFFSLPHIPPTFADVGDGESEPEPPPDLHVGDLFLIGLDCAWSLSGVNDENWGDFALFVLLKVDGKMSH